MVYKVLSSYHPILKQLPETDAVCTLMFQKRTSSSGKLSHLTPIQRAKSRPEPMSVWPCGQHPQTRSSSTTWHRARPAQGQSRSTGRLTPSAPSPTSVSDRGSHPKGRKARI